MSSVCVEEREIFESDGGGVVIFAGRDSAIEAAQREGDRRCS